VSWFERLADVPGVSYESSPVVARTELPGYDSVPQDWESSVTNRHDDFLMWPGVEVGSATSASPAKRHASERLSEEMDLRSGLLRLYEALELPGQLSDYHFAIQDTCKAVYERRREDLTLLDELERLCWLDVELLEAHPEVVASPASSFALSLTSVWPVSTRRKETSQGHWK
jgi:hypothetical protein